MEKTKDPPQEEHREAEGVVSQEGAKDPPDEWTTAALAHASVALSFVLAFAGGVGALVGLAVPLVIYLGYRDRSRFVSFHALQSLIYQVVGMLAYAVLVTVTVLLVVAAWVISGLLSVVLIGFLLMPFALMATLVMVILLLGVPFAWLGYGLSAAYEVYQGRDFRYWLIGDWLEQEVGL